MWNARRNGRWFGWGCLFLSCSILLFRSAAVLRKNHFLEGKVLLQRAAAQAEQLSVDVMMPLLFYDGKEDGRGWMENLLAAVRDQIPALREGSTAENTLSAGTETAETDTAKQDSFPGPGAERGQTESKEQGTEEDQKDGTQKDETQKDGMEITEPESRHQRQNPKRRSLSRRRPSKPAAHRVRFSTRRPTRFRRQFPLTFLLTRRRS